MSSQGRRWDGTGERESGVNVGGGKRATRTAASVMPEERDLTTPRNSHELR
jgi:hypothetical protein